MIDVTGKQPPTTLVEGGTGLDEPRFSPDGKWLTYNDVEPGRTVQIFAIPFPPTGQRYQLSVAGGTQARWRRDGRELFYLAPDATVMSVQIPDGDIRRASPSSPLFRAGLEASASFDQMAPSADGQRFLIRRPIGIGGDRAPVHVIVNFDLKRLAVESGPGSR
jgi:Tol biopolymer transport system component